MLGPLKTTNLEPILKKYVSTGGEGDTITSGQQYAYMPFRDSEEPTDDKRAKKCTVVSFRDLIRGNNDDVGVLVISSHGFEKAIAVEAFASVQERNKKYLEYTTPSEEGGQPEFTKDEITEGMTPDGPAIFATDKLIVKYRQVQGSFVYIDACSGGTLLDAFTGVPGGARVAMGGIGCVGKETSHGYAERFFADLDGQPRQGRSDEARQRLRAVGPAAMAENMVKGSEMFRVSLAGEDTTLAPRVREEPGSFGLRCPIKGGDVIKIIFDTECDPKSIPEVDGNGTISLGTPTWQNIMAGLYSHELQIPVTGDESYKSYKFTLKGGKLKSGNNVATLDGNMNPPEVKDGIGVNAQGPANSKTSPDDYVVEYQDDCKRVH